MTEAPVRQPSRLYNFFTNWEIVRVGRLRLPIAKKKSAFVWRSDLWLLNSRPAVSQCSLRSRLMCRSLLLRKQNTWSSVSPGQYVWHSIPTKLSYSRPVQSQKSRSLITTNQFPSMRCRIEKSFCWIINLKHCHLLIYVLPHFNPMDGVMHRQTCSAESISNSRRLSFCVYHVNNLKLDYCINYISSWTV